MAIHTKTIKRQRDKTMDKYDGAGEGCKAEAYTTKKVMTAEAYNNVKATSVDTGRLDISIMVDGRKRVIRRQKISTYPGADSVEEAALEYTVFKDDNPHLAGIVAGNVTIKVAL